MSNTKQESIDDEAGHGLERTSEQWRDYALMVEDEVRNYCHSLRLEQAKNAGLFSQIELLKRLIKDYGDPDGVFSVGTSGKSLSDLTYDRGYNAKATKLGLL